MPDALVCNRCGAPLQAGAASCPFCKSVFAGSPLVGAPAAVLKANDDAEIVAVLRGGNKIHAIKLYRERYDKSLLNAKNAIDELEKRLGIAH